MRCSAQNELENKGRNGCSPNRWTEVISKLINSTLEAVCRQPNDRSIEGILFTALLAIPLTREVIKQKQLLFPVIS